MAKAGDNIGDVIAQTARAKAIAEVTPEDVANIVLKTIFANGLRADHRYAALVTTASAIRAYCELRELNLKASLDAAKSEARDQMMRADEANLKLASWATEMGKPADSAVIK
jgi:hypothetical protein